MLREVSWNSSFFENTAIEFLIATLRDCAPGARYASLARGGRYFDLCRSLF
jgi:hypothetical protein